MLQLAHFIYAFVTPKLNNIHINLFSSWATSMYGKIMSSEVYLKVSDMYLNVLTSFYYSNIIQVSVFSI